MQMKYSSIVAGLVIAMAVSVFTPESEAGVMIDRVVAVVNDDVITMSELQKEIAVRAQEIRSSQKGKERETELSRLNKDILNLMVERHLQLDFAKKRGISVSDEEVKAAIEDIKKKNGFDDEALLNALEAKNMTFGEYRKTMREEIIVNKLVYREVKSRLTVTESEIAAYYKENKSAFATPATIEAKHALVSFSDQASDDTKKEAAQISGEIIAKLKRGDDFKSVLDDYAKAVVPVSGSNLGKIKKGSLVAELEAAAFALKAGEVTSSIKMADGYHIIKVYETTDAQIKPLKEVSSEISRILFNSKSEEQYYKWLKELRANSFIEVKLGE